MAGIKPASGGAQHPCLRVPFLRTQYDQAILLTYARDMTGSQLQGRAAKDATGFSSPKEAVSGAAAQVLAFFGTVNC